MCGSEQTEVLQERPGRLPAHLWCLSRGEVSHVCLSLVTVLEIVLTNDNLKTEEVSFGFNEGCLGANSKKKLASS